MRSCPRTPTAIDLFCGVGGLSLGLKDAGFRLIGAADSDRHAIETHRRNFPDVKASECDLIKASGASLRESLGLGNGSIDLLSGGPPCQGFSAGGRHTKKDPRNKGVAAFARLVTELRPRYFLMENVRGFTFQEHAPDRKSTRLNSSHSS